eukprot:5409572-Alexandrium_andersonii.AAC.1
MQRDPEVREAWSRHCRRVLGGTMDARRHHADSLLGFLRAESLPLPAFAAPQRAPDHLAPSHGPAAAAASPPVPAAPSPEEVERRALLGALAALGHIALGH